MTIPDMAEFDREFDELMKRSPIVVELSMVEAWSLACAVQVACLWPDFTGVPAALAGMCARALFSHMVKPGTVMEQIVAANWTNDERTTAGRPDPA